jgi:hypothetical protein
MLVAGSSVATGSATGSAAVGSATGSVAVGSSAAIGLVVVDAISSATSANAGRGTSPTARTTLKKNERALVGNASLFQPMVRLLNTMRHSTVSLYYFFALPSKRDRPFHD